MFSKSDSYRSCRCVVKNHCHVATATLIFVLTLIAIAICFVFACKPLSLVHEEPKKNSAVVILDDGCPDTSNAANFRVTCTAVSGAAGKGMHSSMLLRTLINIDRNVYVPFQDLVFVDIADADGRSSKSAITKGLRLAQEYDPLAINLSYSLSQTDIEIEHLLQDLTSNDIKVFAAYSNLFFEEESFPASTGKRLQD